ncbi:hypothetical protein [Vibrio fluvialis]|uniref:hypothetical protein n=1 Tax=Vibrio fluvialis TaxID=676 RepID=UPI00192BF6A1|nr:hypothetical protein [Vibrio fluvialis]MBL4262792.1 hypothetical protein [Vibrio fluvialis]
MSVQDKFFSFVLTYYRNDPYLMLEQFHEEIAKVAQKVSIEWDGTASNVSLDGTKLSGSKVAVIEANDKGRVWVIGLSESKTTSHGNVVKYPLIRFQNFRKHFDAPVFFSGWQELWNRFNEHNQGQTSSRPRLDKEQHKKRVEALGHQAEVLRQAQLQATDKDWRWLQMLHRRNTPCPYLTQKGLSDIHKKVELYQGETTKGVCGEFTAVKALDAATGRFTGLQRLYANPNKKIFRSGFNPNGSAWFTQQPVDGEPIGITEAVADSGLGFDLIGGCWAAAFYADNIPIVALALRKQFPNSKLVFVSDNDQYNDPNKGVESCVKAINLIDGKNYELCVPSFEEKERAEYRKDLTDYYLAYGLDETLKMLAPLF